MASASSSPLTPRRKRAVSGGDLGVYDMPVNIPVQSTPRSTSDMHETPGLDWGTSPASKDGSPSTPSSISTSSKEPHGEALTTPSRTSKKSKRVDQARLRNESQAALYAAADRRPVKLESSDDEPALLLPVSVWSVSSEVDDEYNKLVKSDVTPKNFKFYELLRGPSGYHGKSSRNAAMPPRRTFPLLSEQQVPSSKKEERAIDTIGQTARSGLKVTPSPQGISPRAADIPVSQDTFQGCQRIEENSISRDDHTRGPVTELPTAGSVPRRLTRILPFDTIVRIVDDPTRCVASLVSVPDLRCSKPRKSSQDIKAWLLDHAAKNVNPVGDVIAAESYLRNLVEMATCTASRHRSISVAQLERLLERLRSNLCGKAVTRKSRHNFTKKDEGAIPCWLEALTRLPDFHGNAGVQPNQLVHTLVLDCDPVIAETSVSKSASKFNNDTCGGLEAHQVPLLESGRVEAINTVTVTNSIETTPINQNICNITDIKETHETLKTVKWRNEVDMNGTNQEKQIEETVESFNETTRVGRIKTICIKEIRPETSKITTTTTAIATKSTFDPTQSAAISWVTTQEDRTAKSGDRKFIQTRSTTRQLTIRTLGQEFVDYRPAGSRMVSTETWIRKCLVEPITKQDTKIGIICVYWVKGNFGLVKIGKTSGESTRRRMLEWQEDCGHELQEHTRGAVQLPHVCRVEKLVHAELDTVRLTERACVQCSKRLNRVKSHIEWFQCSPDHAMEVIEKWSEWMRTTNPYELTGKVVTGKNQKKYVGALKGTISEDEITRMCKPIEMLGKPKDARPTHRRHGSSDTSTKKAKGRKSTT